MLGAVNVEERVAALEKLLEKVRTNAALPRPPRQGGPLFAASANVAPPQDDVAGPPLPGIVDASTEIPTAPPPKEAAPMEELWADAPKEAAPKLVALASPLPGAKEPSAGTPKTPAVATTPKPAVATPATAAKPAPTPATAAKPAPAATTPAAKPAPAATPAAKPAPAATPPTAPAKPVTPAAKPIAPTPAAKPAATPAAKPAPIAATLPKAAAQPTSGLPKIAAQKPPEELKKTLQGVGDEAEIHESAPPPDGRDSDAITAPLALNAEQIEMLLAERQAEDEKKTARPAKPEDDKKLAEPEKKALEPAKTGLPSAIADGGDEHEEPTQLYGAASSRRPDVLAEIEAKAAAEPEKKVEPEVISLEADKLPEPPKAAEPEAKPAAKSSEFDEVSLVEELPKEEKKPAAEPEEKKPAAAAKSSEFDEVSLVEELPKEEKKPEPKAAEPEKKPEPKAAEPEKKPAPPPVKKPPVESTVPVKAAPPKQERDITPPGSETTKSPDQKKGGMPAWLLVAALIVLAGSGAFIALKQGWIGGKPATPPPPVDTGATVTPPPTATQTAATTAQAPETPTATATQAPTAEPTAAPTTSASAAPTASASAAVPDKDPAKLPPTKALLIVNSNKPGQIFLTGKLVGNTGEQLEVDCGPKFVRLAEPGESNPAKAKWITPGQSGLIACQKLNTLTINSP
jgi:hypothetical protein